MSTVTAVPAIRTQAETQQGTWSRTDWLFMGALCCVSVVLPVLLSIAAGSFGLPQNDDWSYRRIAVHFLQTGHIVSNGWPSMTLIGQILWSWPFMRVFGDHGWVFAASIVPLALVGVSCAYYLARQVLSCWWTAASVLLVVMAPAFAWSAATYMTDVPAFSAEVACLALGAAALQREGRRHWALLAGSLAVGAFGFSIRQFAVAAPVAVLVCAGVKDFSGRKRWYMAACAATLIVCGLIYLGWSQIPGFHVPSLAPPSLSTVKGAVREYYSMSLILSPAIALAAWRRLRWRQSWATLAAVAVIFFGVIFSGHYRWVFAPNYLDPHGIVSTGLLAGGRPTVLPRFLWDVLPTIAIVSGGLLAGIAMTIDIGALRRWRSWAWSSPLGLISMFAVCFAVGLIGYGLLSTLGLYDRYLWPLVFALAVLLLHSASPPAHREEWPPLVTGILVALSALLILVTTAITIDADTYSAARWRAGQVTVALGVSAKAVDAGFEWVGAHASGPVKASSSPPVSYYEQWYARLEPGFQDCAMVSGSPLKDPDLRLAKTRNYNLLGVIGSRTLYIYLRRGFGCERGPS